MLFDIRRLRFSCVDSCVLCVVVRCVLFVVCCLLLFVLLCVVCCLLFVVWCLVSVACCSSFVVRRLPFDVSFVGCWLLCVVCFCGLSCFV